MRFATIHKLFIFYISTFSIASIAHACFAPHWDVYVTNTISDNIVAHIKSKNDDLGNHTIPFNGNYHWSFCEALFGKTLFYAYFWWGSRFQTLALFDEKLEEAYCFIEDLRDQYCYWFVKPDGFYISVSPDPNGDNVHFIKPWQ
ncbi:unnamed protein product [Lactuca saligna]|uniref:S-protein homolog n=1 Tax=Lactuca saligna TaxID=75948 RepID=A0AA35Z491_LACSI|nr:unnamed protein product [Lactuca saligna]